jgi:site-specific DNA recombinase
VFREPSLTTALYLRVSTGAQDDQGTSLETQEAAAREYCADHGLRAEVVLREVWSGLVLDRPKLDELRELIRGRQVHAVVIYSTDRLSREPVHLLLLLEEWDKAKINTHFVLEPRDDSPEGQLISFVRGWTAKVEALKIAERTQRGRRARAKMGKLPTGTQRYGWSYNRDKGRREINEAEAYVIRQMVAWVIREGLSWGSIRARLHEEAIPAPKGGEWWGLSTIRRILHDSALAGESFGYKYVAVEPLRGHSAGRYGKTRRELRARNEWVDLGDATPPILSREEYEQLQSALRRNSETQPRARKFEYLLTGHVWCATCGRRYTGEPNKQKRYYRCTGRRSTVSPVPCRNPQISADALERYVINWFDEIWTQRDVLRLVLLRFNKPENRKPLQAKLNGVHRRLDKLKGEEARLVNLFVTGEYNEGTLHREKRRIDSERARLSGQWNELSQSLKELTESEIDEAGLEELRRLMEKRWRSMQFEERRQLFKRLKLRVEILPDRTVRLSGLMPLPDVAASKFAEEFPQRVGVNIQPS